METGSRLMKGGNKKLETKSVSSCNQIRGTYVLQSSECMAWERVSGNAFNKTTRASWLTGATAIAYPRLASLRAWTCGCRIIGSAEEVLTRQQHYGCCIRWNWSSTVDLTWPIWKRMKWRHCRHAQGPQANQEAKPAIEIESYNECNGFPTRSKKKKPRLVWFLVHTLLLIHIILKVPIPKYLVPF